MKVYLFACIEKNIGDDLFIKILCERYPNIEFVISAQAQYGSLERIPNLSFSNVLEKWNWASSLGTNSTIKSFIAKIIQKYYEFRLPNYEIGVSIVGNAFKNLEYTGWRQSQWIRERIKLVDKFYLISTNFGPYSDERWRMDFANIFAQMSDVCFRDQYSYNLFSNLDNIRVAPDAVITMGIKKHENNKNVIISLIDCALSVRSDELKNSASKYEKKMADTITLLVSKGYTITLLNSNTKQDRPACNHILDMIDQSNVTVLDYEGDIDEIFELYSKSSYIIGTRLHTIILGWLYNLSVVPIVYDIKVANLLKTCMFEGSIFDITKLQNVTANEIVKALESNSYTIPEHILKKANDQFFMLDKELKKRW